MLRALVAMGCTLALLPCLQAGERPRLFQSPRRPAVPWTRSPAWARNPLDQFILEKLDAAGLGPSAEADRLRLLRRVTFTLTGMPPTLDEQASFLEDRRPGAYERVVDRLLASPRFGERWAQHWLDVVRYAETDGFNQDAHRPAAFRYRDWVIRAFNANVPYDRFLSWQLAGDELAPGSPDALLATGLNRLWPDEYNAAKLQERRQEILDDNTDTVGLAFLGLTVGCARCHDHKYDPISQKDYFRLQAFFAAMQPRDLPVSTAADLRQIEARQAVWEKATASVRSEMDAIISSKRKQLSDYTLTRFNDEIQKAVQAPPEKRTPYQWQIALMAQKQLDRGADGAMAKLSADQKKRYQELEKKLADFGPAPRPPLAHVITDIGPVAPPTYRLVGGSTHKPAAEVQPGFPASLGGGELDTSLAGGLRSTGRRAALARWMTRPDHPLTARVIVNRLWQHHFGQGIVVTGNDFGAQGGKPSHPGLLDWLATELVRSGWDLKHLHRLMVTSATFRQDSSVEPTDPAHARAMKVDPNNDLLWRARRRRVEGEALRDGILALSGDLNLRMFGPSARPELPEAVGKAAWRPDEKVHDRHRRSVYVLAKRNLRYPMFEAFDQPDLHNSCSRRLSTTTAPQALLLLNSDFVKEKAARWMTSLQAQHGGPTQRLVADAYRAAWGRPAHHEEVALALRFLGRQAQRDKADPDAGSRRALADFGHAVLNTNEFVYID